MGLAFVRDMAQAAVENVFSVREKRRLGSQ
jgi:hypothetical protein